MIFILPPSVLMGLSENSVPLFTQWLMIIIPIKWLFHWEYTQHFQTNPSVLMLLKSPFWDSNGYNSQSRHFVDFKPLGRQSMGPPAAESKSWTPDSGEARTSPCFGWCFLWEIRVIEWRFRASKYGDIRCRTIELINDGWEFGDFEIGCNHQR